MAKTGSANRPYPGFALFVFKLFLWVPAALAPVRICCGDGSPG